MTKQPKDYGFIRLPNESTKDFNLRFDRFLKVREKKFNPWRRENAAVVIKTKDKQ